ncbi:MAG: hypothetical protein ACREWE_01785 [Gammaproteobacteria bacterium]
MHERVAIQAPLELPDRYKSRKPSTNISVQRDDAKLLHIAYGVLKSGQPFNPALHGY